LGADTKNPSADDKVAAKIPMVIKWPDPETVVRTWRKTALVIHPSIQSSID